MNILHVATDEKFIDQAYTVFNIAFPKKNDVLILSKSDSLRFAKNSNQKVIKFGFVSSYCSKVPKDFFKKYELVVFHSFGDSLYPEIFNVPENVATVWLGWGYDYYDLISKPGNLLLPETKKIAFWCYQSITRAFIIKSLRSLFKLINFSKSRKKAIQKVDFFSPVISSEYDLVRQSRKWCNFPEYVCWNYGTIEDHLIKGFENAQIEGNAILIGNSASLTCNHKETLDFLHESGISGRKIIAPLSYGDKFYGEKIIKIGEGYFGDEFNALKDFIDIEEYVAIIKKCGYVIMNHKRQQAVGNIVIMLCLGARVFLREENPVFAFFKNLGAAVTSVQELEQDISLLNIPLTNEEKKVNKRLVSEYWSRDASVARTKALVERALELAKKSGCESRGCV